MSAADASRPGDFEGLFDLATNATAKARLAACALFYKAASENSCDPDNEHTSELAVLLGRVLLQLGIADDMIAGVEEDPRVAALFESTAKAAAHANDDGRAVRQ